MSKIFAFGDIHGCNQQLKLLLKNIDPHSDDTLIFLGDMIDRGDDSKGVIDTIWQYEKICHVISIMGNHEEMMLNALKYADERKYWFKFGGIETLQSFNQPPDLHGILAISFQYFDWLKRLKPYYETDDFIFCHAMPFYHLSMHNQTSNGLRWRFIEKNDSGHISNKKIICGHTAQKSGNVLVQNNIICIDTYACGGQKLTALEINNMMAWQIDNQLNLTKTLLKI